MENLISVEIPTLTLQPILKGTNIEISFNAYTNSNQTTLFTELTNSTIIFEFKKSKDSKIIFSKFNSFAGGADDQIKINTSSSLSLYFIPADTELLADGVYFGSFKITTNTGLIFKKYLSIPII